uniref:serine/threonine-protein kinase n=1 Tax=Nocardia farcinica TaxID=37329 RepID=UPI002454BEEA
MLTNGAMIADRYRLQRLIATGGMGQVWEALDTRLNRRVAVKVLKAEFSADPTFRQRFRTEAQTTAQLNHSGIAGIYDYGETYDPSAGETSYLVMELVQGEPLNAVLSRLGKLSVNQGLDMLEQTGRALEVAHAAGVVHRDVKPGNILVTPTGQVKITDFGIAKAVDASPVTKTGMVMGTAQYIAPEQAVGEDATAASDVYSLGVVGYEALAGKRPFSGDGAITVAMKHVRETPPPMPADVPANVRELIEITMGKDPQLRYASGGEFADAVAAVRAGHRPPPPIGAAAARPIAEEATPREPPGPPGGPRGGRRDPHRAGDVHRTAGAGRLPRPGRHRRRGRGPGDSGVG